MRTRLVGPLFAMAVVTVLGSACNDDTDSAWTSVDDADISTTGEDTESDDSLAPTTVPDDTESGTTTDSKVLEIDDRIDQAGDALTSGDFSTMLNLLQLSSVADEIDGREITILAPTEEAFGALTTDEVSDLLTNPTKIDDILKRHIIDDLVTFEELSTTSSVTMLSGDTFAVVVDGDTITIEGALVTEGDSEIFRGENGQEVAAFAIDRVLLDED